jgi:hypothetical protein
MSRKKKSEIRFTMEAKVIATGELVSWIAYDSPDYGALDSGRHPASLTGVAVKGQGKLRS